MSTEFNSMTGSDVKEVMREIEVSIRTREPLFIWGPPGIGKSTLVYEVASRIKNVEDKPYKVKDVRMAYLEPSDLLGLPKVTGVEPNLKTFWIPPSFLPRPEDGPTVLFLDELNLGQSTTTKAAYQLILDRRLHEYILPDEDVIIAAGNTPEDKTGVIPINPALANRFRHITMRPPTDSEWIVWAVPNKVHPDIIAFITFQPALLFKPGAGKNMAWPSPRSWAKASIAYSSKPLAGNVAMSVGKGAGTQFESFVELRSKLPDVWDVVKGKAKIKDTDKGLWLTAISAIASQLPGRMEDGPAVLDWAGTIDAEYGILLIKMLKAYCYDQAKARAQLVTTPQWVKSSGKWAKYF